MFRRSLPHRIPSILQVASVAAVAFVFALSSRARAQTKPPASPVITPGQVTIDQFRSLVYRPSDQYFNSEHGPVRILITDADTGKTITLYADDAEGYAAGDIQVFGHLKVERSDGVVAARSGVYHGQSGTGEMYDAESTIGGYLLRGVKMELLRDDKGRQYLHAQDGYFTTCTLPKPHFHITARDIRVTADKTVIAKHVGFYVGEYRLLTLPSMTRSFGQSSEAPLPLPGYSNDEGPHIRFRNELIDRPATLLNYDITVSTIHTPSGTVTFEHDLGHPTPDEPAPRTRQFLTTEPLRTALETSPALLVGAPPEITRRRTDLYAQLTSSTFVYNRQRTDLVLDRFPEVGISFRNILNRPPPTESQEPAFPRPESAFGIGFFSPAKWFVNAEAGVGYFEEGPTHTRDTRLGTRADATSPLFLVEGPLYVRYGATAWANVYGGGDAYALVAPEAEMDWLLKRNTLVGAGYSYMKDFGSTPFVFDRKDIVHELSGRYAFLGNHWAYDAEIRADLQRFHAYDNVFRIVRRLDCLEYGVAFHTRNRSLSLVFNLLPAKSANQPAQPAH